MKSICSRNNRSILMGMSIIPVIICHITQFVGEYKGITSSIADEFLFVSAAVGVDIFFFFSLVGLGFSYRNNSISRFYGNRIKRIFPAYIVFLLVVLLFFLKLSVSEKIILLVEQLTGASIFCKDKIEWYLPSLILLYVLYPLLIKVVEKIHRKQVYEIATLVILIVASYPLYYFVDGLFALRLPLFFLSIVTFLYIEEDQDQSQNLVMLYIIAMVLSFFIKNRILSYALIIPGFLFIFNIVIDKIAITKWGRGFSWLGKYTLHIYLAQIIATKYIIAIMPTNNIIIIVLSVFLATFIFSIFFYYVERLVLSKVVNNH